MPPSACTLAFLPSATNELVPAAVRTFRAAFPAVVLELSEQLDDAQLEALAQGRLDVGVLRTTRELDDVAFEALAVEDQCVAVARDHRLAGRKRVSFRDLRGEDSVLWPRRIAPETHDAIVERCRAAGFSPRVVQDDALRRVEVGPFLGGAGQLPRRRAADRETHAAPSVGSSDGRPGCRSSLEGDLGTSVAGSGR